MRMLCLLLIYPSMRYEKQMKSIVVYYYFYINDYVCTFCETPVLFHLLFINSNRTLERLAQPHKACKHIKILLSGNRLPAK